MKSSCVNHPKNEPLIIVRQWQIKFCDGNKCAAALMSQFEYWHNIKLEMASKNSRLNEVAETHGEKPIHDVTVLQFHTAEELSDGILHLYGRTAIADALKLLEAKGVITTHANPNPKYRFDKTKYFQFHPDVCNEWLSTYANDNHTKNHEEGDEQAERNKSHQNNTLPNSVDRSPKTAIDLPDLVNRATGNGQRSTESGRRSTKNGKPITETTAEIITQKAAAKTTIERTSTNDVSSNIPQLAAAFCVDNENRVPKDSHVPFDTRPQISSADGEIGELLTPTQQQLIASTAKQLVRDVTDQDVDGLAEEIAYTLQNPSSFTQAGNDFLKKLNTVRKVIRDGRWTRPTMLAADKTKHAQKTREPVVMKLRELQGEQSHWQWLLDIAKERQDQPMIDEYQQLITQCQQAIGEVSQQLQAVSSATEKTKGV